MCRQARDAQEQLSSSSAALDSAQLEVTQLKTLAAERQKRFVMLNGTFKKKEDGLRERVDAAERQVADAQREAEAAQAQAASALKVKGQTVNVAMVVGWEEAQDVRNAHKLQAFRFSLTAFM